MSLNFSHLHVYILYNINKLSWGKYLERKKLRIEHFLSLKVSNKKQIKTIFVSSFVCSKSQGLTSTNNLDFGFLKKQVTYFKQNINHSVQLLLHR